ncbi:MAG: DNA repair protein RecN [Tissierellia bacterium]|nr:DNA repair protein RecN [Tissierellia bacterium]
MLVELSIKDFAIIDNIKINFTKGLNVITGETGSGKSILIEALGMILGSRTSKDFIRTGCDKAVLEGVFYIEDLSTLRPILNDLSIDIDHDNLLIITKEIFANGPSLSKVNGRAMNLTMLKTITTKLVDIFGQHEHQSLLDINNHQLLVDAFGDEDFTSLKSTIKELYDELQEEKKKIKSLSMDSGERDREIDILRFQIEEIDEANLTMEDEHSIEAEFKKLSNINKISQSVELALSYLDSDDYDFQGAINLVNKSLSLVSSAKEFDEKLESFFNRLSEINYELQDINRELNYYLNSIDIDMERLNYLHERIDLVNKLKRKYGNSIDSIFKFRDEAEERLNKLLNFEKEYENSLSRIKELEEKLDKNCSKLSEMRKKIANILEENVKAELSQLNMSNVDFKVDFIRTAQFTPQGFDKIEFLISTNPGEGLKPLSKIISGGEMSRIMLAIKSILAFLDKIPTLIFDEIDAGISGRTAQIVGEKIYNISKKHQVICISHLPQIAALADSHFVINKVSKANRTISEVSRLSDQERVEEMARLIGGVDLTTTTLKHASEMIEMSKILKNNSRKF